MAIENYFLSQPRTEEVAGELEDRWDLVEVTDGQFDLITRRRFSGNGRIQSQIILDWEAGDSAFEWYVRWRIEVFATGALVNESRSRSIQGGEAGSTTFGPKSMNSGLARNTEYELFFETVQDGAVVNTSSVRFWTDRTPEVTINTPANEAEFQFENSESFDLTWTVTDEDAITGPSTAPEAEGWYDDYAGWEMQYREVGDTEWRHAYVHFNSVATSHPSYALRPDLPGATNNVLDAHATSLHVNIEGASTTPGSLTEPWVSFGPGVWEVRVRVFDYGAYDSSILEFPTYSVSEWTTVQFTVTGNSLPPVPLYPTDGIAVEDPVQVDPETLLEIVNPFDFRWDFRDPRTISTQQCGIAFRIREEGGEWVELVNELDDMLNHMIHPSAEYLSLGADPNIPWTTLNGADPVEVSNVEARIGSQSYIFDRGAASGPLVEIPGSGFFVPIASVDIPASMSKATIDLQYFAPAANSAAYAVGLWRESTGEYVAVAVAQPSGLGWSGFHDTITTSSPGAGEMQIHVLAEESVTGVLYVDTIAILDQDLGAGDLSYWDGDTPDTTDYTYSWTSAAGSSTSLRQKTPGGGSVAYEDGSLTFGSAENDRFPLNPGTRYQWQVRTEGCPGDHDSWWTAPIENFWVVPQPGLGYPLNTAPVPDDYPGTGLVTVADPSATLGCGTHQVFAYDRGGQRSLGEITELSYIQWGRVRDDVSSCTIRINGWSNDCGALLAGLHSWVHELVVYRDTGLGQAERVWEGPITLMTFEEDQVEIQARDVMAYPYRRIMRHGYSDAYPNVKFTVERAKIILQNALAYDDPNVLAFLTPIITPDDAREVRTAHAYTRTAWQEVDDLAAKAGMDYCTVGRRILLFDTHNPPSVLPDMSDGDFDKSPVVTEYGMRLANAYGVTNNNGIFGLAHKNPGDFYGYVEMLVSSWGEVGGDDATLTDAQRQAAVEALESQARAGIDQRWPTPEVVRVPQNSRLSPDLPITIGQLIPGAQTTLHAGNTLRRVSRVLKVDSITVQEDKDGEKVLISFSQASGFFDPNAEEEDEE